ncbi:hypothetical protein F4819DRAFT_352453 [Hypoxylon fuscum]|nr:hypothetical protein F4819DRAFT_352453 [Hypoxylon fuscum]
MKQSASPTGTHPSSRSPTPSPETRPEVSRPPRRLRSRSPTLKAQSGHRRRESSGSVRKIGGDDTPRDASSKQQSSANPGSGASAPKKPLIAQAVGPSKPPPPPSPTLGSSPPAGPPSPLQPILKEQEDEGPFPRSLLGDVSLYTNPHLTPENEGTTLEELAHLVRLSKYQERKCANTRIRLQRSLISTALSARLTRCGEISLRNLADSFRNDDKRAFANLFGAIHDVRNSCDATRRYALLEPEMESLQSSGVASVETLVPPLGTNGTIGSSSSVAPFLQDISASAREAFLSFLTQIRTNPDYLATRLCSLNTSELHALTTFHQGLEPIESVLPYHGGRPTGRGHSSGPSRQSAQTPTAVERLLSFQRHDPLSALIYTCFANSAGPDSAEDKRRTGIWATAFSRLISTKSTSEPVLISILNAWSAMRDWSGRANMEWYLMKILEDGAFLLDRAEDQQGTRFNLSGYSSKETIAADEFYERAVNDLFAIIDDEDSTGIPEGVIELGNEILRRLEVNHSTRGLVDTTRKWFVYKWLFSSWLLAVVIHPESYGMMAEYHITEYSRQKILKHVATTAQHAVIEMLQTNNPQRPVSTPPKIKGHVESILARFKPSGKRTGRLLPARSITSLRETVEVHPYLVISPADLATLVNALYPERRPQSAHSSSIRSGAPSISGFSAISQPISIGTSRSNFDTASVLSMSTSSVFSDGTTSGEPLLEDQVVGTPQRRSPPVPDGARQNQSSNYEDDGYRLRLAMHEMAQNLGPEAISGSCHPCAERWAVVFISADGNGLSTQMTYDPDDDPEEENSSTTSDTEDDEPDEKPELDKDYHSLRDSVLKLVEDFEIPQGIEDHGAKTTFSNRANGLKKYRSKNKIITTNTSMGSRNPYRSKCEQEHKSKLVAEESPRTPEEKDSASEPGSSPVLITMLAAASSQSRIQSDFVSAHLYWKTLQQLNALTSSSLRKNGFATLLNIFSRGPRDSIRRSASAIEEYDAWLVWLKQSQERHEGLTETMMKRLKALRDKMWYVTDVHNSAPYEHTRNICSALKIMGAPGKWSSFQRNRAQLARGPASAYIFRNESQMLDLLAASEDQGGPNKLSDAQAEITSKWLQQFGIQNLCTGEERIHRFCCEVDSCVGKLVGESLVDGPVLWSSELYSRDRKTFEGSRIGRGDRESVWGDDAASVISSDHERRYASPSGRGPGSVRGDLRNMSGYNTSQVSVDSHHRYSFSRASTALSDTGYDGHDYFGASSPMHGIDSTSTFWSPFQSTMSTVSSATSRAQSPTTSVTNLSSAYSSTGNPNHQPLPSHHSASRSGASVSSNETVHLRRLSEGKQRFLLDLRQTLTSLLLSELGNQVFASGSETDGWFGTLGQECIERRDNEQRRLRRPSTRRERTSKSSAKQRVIEKRKSFGNLRQAGEVSILNLNNDVSRPDLTRPDLPRADLSRPDSPYGPSHDSASAASDTASIRGKSSRYTRKKDTPEFPYTKAYQRLLGMFAVHPNPYTKLNALLELERLVAASLSSGGRRSRWASRHQSGSVEDDSGLPGKADTAESSMDSPRERRAQTFQSHMFPLQPRPNKNSDARSVISIKEASNTDAIAQVLRSLFKDAGIRPKTLFRDLQFINSFVSPSTLDTDRNKPFWDIIVVALSLKQDVITTMVEVADEVLNFYTPSRKRPSSDESPEMLRPPPLYSLEDAATMWTIAAKEGHATAQRELGLFNLSHPELVARSTLPLSKPRDVFKQAVMEKFGARSGSMRYNPDRSRSNLGAAGPSSSGMQDGGMDGDVRSDPTLMCVAIHWMKEAERGGDELARQFLSQNEMMGL